VTTVSLQPATRLSPRSASWLGVIVIVLAVAATAAIGGTVTAPAVRTWYPDLPKPSWTPHPRIFGPVWTVLYALMAVAASMVWVMRGRGNDICCPMAAFGVQLLLNLAWSVLFFGLRSPLLGFLDICLLWVAAGVTVTQFFLISRPAGWLLTPYWAWLTFAVALNAAIVLQAG
jgi:tryptophan-rich sensory protein